MAPSLPSLPGNFATAQELIDQAHAQDPNKVKGKDGAETDAPYELHYAKKMTAWLAKRAPDASPVLQLACRAQHFRRWEIPRSSYPMTRPGYLTWRAKLKAQAAVQVAELLRSSSISPPIPDADIDQVAALIRKEGLAGGEEDVEVQVLEDAACLVFLDDQFEAFETSVDEDKMVGILRKTWGKMSPAGRDLALQMDLGDRPKELVVKALEGS